MTSVSRSRIPHLELGLRKVMPPSQGAGRWGGQLGAQACWACRLPQQEHWDPRVPPPSCVTAAAPWASFANWGDCISSRHDGCERTLRSVGVPAPCLEKLRGCSVPGTCSAPKTASSPTRPLLAHTTPCCPRHFWGSMEASLGSPWKTTLGHVEMTSVISWSDTLLFLCYEDGLPHL